MAELKVKSNTVSAVDLFKCIFAICVVAIHTMAFKDHGESAYFAFTYCIHNHTEKRFTSKIL